MKISSFFRNIGIISGATILAQVINVFSLPILTRIYTVQDFEDFGVFVASIAILSSVSSLRFNIAIPLARDNKDLNVLTHLSLLFAVMISAFLIGLYWFFKNSMPTISYVKYEWFVPAAILGALGLSVYTVCVAVASYSKEFVIISKSKVIRSLAANAAQIGLGFFSLGGGLLVGYLVLCWGGVVIFFRSFAKSNISVLNIPKSEIKKTFFEKIEYPVYSVPEILFFNLGSNLPIIIIAAFTQNAEAGVFFLALKLISIPMLFLGQSISTVYMSYAPKEETPEGLLRLTKDTVKKLFYFAGIPLVLIGISAPFYTTFIFGSDWTQVGYYVAWLAIGSMFQLLSSPLTISLHIMKKIKLAMIIQLILLFVKLVPLSVALHYGSKFYLEIFAVSNVFAYLILVITIFFNLNKFEIGTRSL